MKYVPLRLFSTDWFVKKYILHLQHIYYNYSYASMIRNLFYPGRNWNLKSRNLAEKKFDYKFRLARNIHEENCLKSENIGDIASSYDFRSQVDSSAVFDAQYVI